MTLLGTGFAYVFLELRLWSCGFGFDSECVFRYSGLTSSRRVPFFPGNAALLSVSLTHLLAMKACIQRVHEARVTVEDEVVGQIDRGLLVLLGVGHEDTPQDVDYLARKLVGLRIFEDEQGKMNRSLADVGGEMLVVSQFTLWGDCRKGRRPSFILAAPPELAERLYEYFCSTVQELGIRVAKGRFRAHMDVALTNDGPVTLNVES